MRKFSGLGVFLLMCFVLGKNVFAAAGEAPLREVHIRAVVSSSFKQNPDWKKEIIDRVLFANTIYEKNFSIHFSVKDYTSWEPENETRAMTLLLEELRAHTPLGPEEIVVGFHKMTKPFASEAGEDMDTVGSAQSFRGYIVIRDRFETLIPMHRNVIMAHELSHLFGAVHVADTKAMMYPVLPMSPELNLDPQNSQIVKLSRQVDFQKGIDSFTNETIDSLILIYEKLIAANPRGDFYRELGYFYQKRNLPARAIKIWEDAIRYHFDDPYIHRELGFYYYQSGRYDSAIRELGAAVAHYVLPSQKRQRAETFNYLGVAYFQKGNYEQAIFTWLKGLAADPDNKDLQGNLAIAYMQNGDMDRAISELEKMRAKNPGDGTTLMNLGACYMNKGEYQKALDLFKEAQEKGVKNSNEENSLVKDNPDYILHQNLGGAYLKLDQNSQAVEEFKKALAINPQDFEAHKGLAQAYGKLKQFDDSVKEIQTALRYKKDDPYLYAFLGQAYAETGKKTEALQAARDGIQYATGDLKAGLYRNAAVIYAQDKQYPEAIRELQNALNIKWNDTQAHYYLGMMYAQTGKIEDAKRSLQNALRVDPNNKEAKDALNAITKQTAPAK